MLLPMLAYLAIIYLIWPLGPTRFCATLFMLSVFTIAARGIAG